MQDGLAAEERSPVPTQAEAIRNLRRMSKNKQAMAEGPDELVKQYESTTWLPIVGAEAPAFP